VAVCVNAAGIGADTGSGGSSSGSVTSAKVESAQDFDKTLAGEM